MRAALLIALATGTTAIVCPPRDDALPLKAEGEACGGACDSQGACAEGLKCVVPKTSPLSFAILMAPARAGTCVGPVEAAENGKERRLTDKRELVGAPNAADLEDKDLVAAASFAAGYISSMSNSLTAPQLDTIVSATKQVVVRYIAAPLAPSPSPCSLTAHLQPSNPPPPLCIKQAGIKYSLVLKMSDGQRHIVEVNHGPG